MDKIPNLQYKDALFKFIFGNEEHKEYALSLYNAINGSNYENYEDIKIVTLNDIVYISMKNDVGILFNNTINLWEQQSTWNPNMPYRMFEYIAKELIEYVKANKLKIYSSSKIKLPTPKCVVFYNGDDTKPEKKIIKLSELFAQEGSDIECTVAVYNINKGMNDDLAKNCKPLFEYRWIVSKIVDYQNSNGKSEETLVQGIENALDELPEDFLIRGFLLNEREKVTNMLHTEFAEKEWSDTFKAEGYENGFKQGEQQGMQQGLQQGELLAKNEIIKKLYKMNYTTKDICEIVGLELTNEQIEEIVK